MKLYFNLKLFFHYLLPFFIVVILVVWGIVAMKVESRKLKYLKEQGYKAVVRSPISGYNDHTTYDYVNESTGHKLSDYEIDRLKLKQIKALVKERSNAIND